MTTPSTSRPVLNLDKILRRLIPLICLGVLGNLAFSFFTTERRYLTEWSGFSPGWLLAGMALSLLPWGWHCIRLKIWTRFLGENISWKNLLRIVIATDVGGAATPTAVGGAPLKLFMLMQQGLRPGHATLLTLLGNVEDVLFYAILIPLSLCWTEKWDHPLWEKTSDLIREHRWAMAAVAGLLLLSILIFSRLFQKMESKSKWREQLRRTLGEFREALQLIRSGGRKPFLLGMLALSAQWLTRFSVLAAVLMAFHLDVDFLQIYWLQWMVFAAILLVPTPGAIGGAEAAFLLVFGAIFPAGSAPVVMACWRLLTYYFMLLTGVLLLGWQLKNANEKSPAT